MTRENIQRLNDFFRLTGEGGMVVATSGINEMFEGDMKDILKRVKYFSDFNEGNDPHEEHDFGNFEHNSNKIFWKIDYFSDSRMEFGSEDPSDPDKTFRVLTIMLASEY